MGADSGSGCHAQEGSPGHSLIGISSQVPCLATGRCPPPAARAHPRVGHRGPCTLALGLAVETALRVQI